MSAWVVSGCTGIGWPVTRHGLPDHLVRERGWRAEELDAGSFTLRGYREPTTQPGQTLSIYLEGDGLAFLGPRTISADPTPRDPMALKLALQHPPGTGPVAYLARPCHYRTTEALTRCHPKYWTSHRYAPEVVQALSLAITRLKSDHPQVREVALYGYSGGGTLALLVAARRHDVARVVTIAGNLDHGTWSQKEGLAPLHGSLNPADETAQLRTIPQLHFAGAADETVPAHVGRAYMARLASHQAVLRVMEGFDHHCCWERHWPRLLAESGMDPSTPSGTPRLP